MAVGRSRVSLAVIDRTKLVDEGRVVGKGGDIPCTDTAASFKANGRYQGSTMLCYQTRACGGMAGEGADMWLCDNFEMPIPSLHCYLTFCPREYTTF